MLERLFKRLVARGHGHVIKTLTRAARRWHGKPYHSDPSRRHKATFPTLRRLYYMWLKRGNAGLLLNYRGPHRGPRDWSVDDVPAMARDLVVSAVKHRDVVQWKGAADRSQLAHHRAYHALRAGCSPKVRSLLDDLFHHRRQVAACERALLKALKRTPNNKGGEL